MILHNDGFMILLYDFLILPKILETTYLWWVV